MGSRKSGRRKAKQKKEQTALQKNHHTEGDHAKRNYDASPPRWGRPKNFMGPDHAEMSKFRHLSRGEKRKRKKGLLASGEKKDVGNKGG